MIQEKSVMAVIRAFRPTFRNQHDKIAFAINSTFFTAGFSLIAVGRTALGNNPPTEGEEVGIEGWNGLEDEYGFVYFKSENESKRAIRVKCLSIDEYLMVDIVVLFNKLKAPSNLLLYTNDYVTEDVGHQTSYAEMYKNLRGLVKSLDTSFWTKLEPKDKTPESTNCVVVDEMDNFCNMFASLNQMGKVQCCDYDSLWHCSQYSNKSRHSFTWHICKREPGSDNI